jgi:hypothetical protein
MPVALAHRSPGARPRMNAAKAKFAEITLPRTPLNKEKKQG